MDNNVEQVLANWIELALSPTGELPKDVPPSRWVAEKFLRWWRNDFEGHLDASLGDAETALSSIREQLQQRGGWEKFGEALHECAHLSEALETIRGTVLPKQE
jgi:hypothetical protein